MPLRVDSRAERGGYVAADERKPGGLDPTVPNVARMYDYYLGGKDNYAIDRAAAEEVLAAIPQARRAARQNRQFLRRVVRYLTQDAGIRQFIDIGSGLPTQANVHEVAHADAPDARVVYVDSDPVVVAHARALLGSGSTTAISADARRPDEILGHPETRRLIDFGQPLAVLFLSVLHFVGDAENPYALVAQFRDVMPSGSHLALSHGTSESRQEITGAADVYEQRRAASVHVRSREEILRFFDGFELVDPGLVFAPQWRADWSDLAQMTELELVLGGVGRKR